MTIRQSLFKNVNSVSTEFRQHILNQFRQTKRTVESMSLLQTVVNFKKQKMKKHFNKAKVAKDKNRRNFQQDHR